MLAEHRLEEERKIQQAKVSFLTLFLIREISFTKNLNNQVYDVLVL